MNINTNKCPLTLRISIVFFLIILLLSLTQLSGCSRNNNSVILAGSTSVQPFAEVLAEDYMILHPGIKIDVQGGGSAAGIMATKSGTTDIGMSSRNLAGDETSLWSVEIARDGLAIVINPQNSIGNLTLEQVRDIYSGAIKNWSSLGGKKSEIHVFTREDGSGTRSSFESLVMGKTEIMAGAMVENSNGAIRQLVGGDPYAIGFISLGLVDKTVKALELDGVTATREHVIDGSYNLSRPFLFLTLKEPTGLAKDFIDFTLSDKGKAILNAQGLVTMGVNP
jgi:phosphate transport system substrate-binding protein